MLKQTIFILLMALLVLPAGARTWTSVSGATVEAEMLSLEGEVVVLRTADGRQLRIRLDQLSAEDRQYARSREGERPQRTPEVAPEEGALAAAPRTYRVDDFPSVNLQSPVDAVYIGLQYGSASDDVALFAFDVPAGELQSDSMYVYAPKLAPYRTPASISASSRRIDGRRVKVFRGVELAGTYGNVRARFDVEFLFGPVDDSLLWVKADARLAGPGGACEYTIGGNVNSVMTVGRGNITVLPLVSRPQLVFRVRRPPRYTPPSVGVGIRGQPTLLSIYPRQNMDRRMRITVTGEDGRTYETHTHAWSPDELFEPMNHRDHQYRLSRTQPGQAYTISVTTDLGPIFGEITGEYKFDYPP